MTNDLDELIMITVSLPLVKPQNVQLALVEGGDLDPNTTYYIKVAAFNNERISCQTYNNDTDKRGWYHSPVSDEVSITTSSTHKSIQVDWDVVTGAATYCTFISKISEDYTGAYSPTRNSGDFLDVINNSYVIDIEFPTISSVQRYACHSAQLDGNLQFNLSKNSGIIEVLLTGNDSHTLQDIYNEVVSAGFSENIYYDGYNFALKGGLYIPSYDTGTGSLVVENKSITMVRGFIAKYNDNFSIRFGAKIDDIIGADDSKKCIINLQNVRHPFWPGSIGDNNPIEVYGCTVTQSEGLLTIGYDNYYYRQFLNVLGQGELEKFQYNNMNENARFRSFDIIRNLNGVREYYASGTATLNCILNELIYLHSIKKDGWYDCIFVNPQHDGYLYWPGDPETGSNYYRRFYNCLYPQRSNSKFLALSRIIAPDYINHAYVEQYYSVDVTLLDPSGNPIEGATVSVKGFHLVETEKFYFDKDNENRVTGDTGFQALTTDENGKAYAYLKFYMAKHPDGDPDSYAMEYINYYPFYLYITADGYKGYEAIFIEPKKYEMEITLDWESPRIESLIITEASIGNNDGTVEITVTGGYPNYSYSKDGRNFKLGSNILNDYSAGSIFEIWIRDSKQNEDSIIIDTTDIPPIYYNREVNVKLISTDIGSEVEENNVKVEVIPIEPEATIPVGEKNAKLESTEINVELE